MNHDPASPRGDPSPRDNAHPARSLNQVEFLVTAGIEAYAELKRHAATNPEAAKILIRLRKHFKKLRGSDQCQQAQMT